MKKIVYLPIELSARELTSKSLLAIELSARGYQVIMGQQWAIFQALPYLPPGILLFKSYHKIYSTSMKYAFKKGFKVLALEEEFISSHDDDAIRSFVNDGLANRVHMILANNAKEESSLLAHGFNKVVVTGNPRFDLLSKAYRQIYDDDVANIKKQYGNFILINTNLTYINSSLKSHQNAKAAAIQSGFLRDDDVSIKLYEDTVQYEKDCLKLVDDFVLNYQGNIILRPHPGEDLDFWKKRYQHKNTLQVIREGDHVPWTLACSTLIHCSCTTAIEANILGRSSINFVLNDDLLILKYLSGANYGAKVKSANEAISIISKIKDPVEIDSNAESILAIKKIADVIDTILVEEYGEIDWVWSGPVSERNDSKCPIDSFDLLNRFIKLNLSSHQIKIQKKYKNLYRVSDENLTDTPVLLVPDISDVECQLEKYFKLGDYAEVLDIFKNYNNEAMRTAKSAHFATKSLINLGKPDRAILYLDQIDSVTNDFPYYLAADKVEILAKKNKNYAEKYAHQYHLKNNNLFSYEIYKKIAGRGVAYTIFGDSHVRYFRYIQKNSFEYFQDRSFFDCHEYGGATAFGLANKQSVAGALVGFQKKVLDSLRLTGNLITHFGEIDCRRAAWRYAADNNLDIHDVVNQSLKNYQDFLVGVSRGLNTVTVFGAKPPITSEKVLQEVALTDPRIVVTSTQKRVDITNYFNSQMQLFCKEKGFNFISIQNLNPEYFTSQIFYEKSKWDAIENDVHGNIRLFSNWYAKAMSEVIKC